MLHVTVEMGLYNKLERKTHSMLATGMRKAVLKAGDVAVDSARTSFKHRKRTGNLTSAQAITFHLVKQDPKLFEGVFQNLAKNSYGKYYASVVENDTRGAKYPITPRNKDGWLKLPPKGNLPIFWKQVMHPGSKAFPFMEPAAKRAERMIVWEFESVERDLVNLWDG